MWGQTKVYELITETEWTNQNAKNALSKVENLIAELHARERSPIAKYKIYPSQKIW